MHSRSPEQSASFKKTSRPEATAEGPQAKASAGRCLAAGHAPNGVFQGQPAPACPPAHPWGAMPVALQAGQLRYHCSTESKAGLARRLAGMWGVLCLPG